MTTKFGTRALINREMIKITNNSSTVQPPIQDIGKHWTVLPADMTRIVQLQWEFATYLACLLSLKQVLPINYRSMSDMLDFIHWVQELAFLNFKPDIIIM